MSLQLLHFVKKKTDILVEQPKTSSEQTLALKINLSRHTFSFDSRLSLQRNKWLLDLTNLVFYALVSIITNTKKIFSIITDGNWTEPVTLEKNEKVIRTKSLNDHELHVYEVGESGTEKEAGSNSFDYSDLGA